MLGGLAGATAAYLVQFKGWNYQLVPAVFFVFLSALWITMLDRSRVRQHVLLGVLSLSAIVLSLGLQLMKGPYPSRTTKDFERYVNRPRMPVLVLSSNVWASFPFINDVDARWTSRYPAQWLLPRAVSLIGKTDCEQDADACEGYRGIVQGQIGNGGRFCTESTKLGVHR